MLSKTKTPLSVLHAIARFHLRLVRVLLEAGGLSSAFLFRTALCRF